MIENERQYSITQKKLKEIKADITQVKNATDQHPLRNELILASLLLVQKDLEEEISLYESVKTNQSSN